MLSQCSPSAQLNRHASYVSWLWQQIQRLAFKTFKTHLLNRSRLTCYLDVGVCPCSILLLHHATLLHLCTIPRHYHHDHMSHWLPCISMSLHIIWASVHSRTSDIAMTWIGAVPSNVKKLVQSRRFSSCCVAYLKVTSLFAMVRDYELYIGMLESRSDCQPAYPVYISCLELSCASCQLIRAAAF